MAKRPAANSGGGLPIPPRWLHCPRKGALVADLFVPFKTPLDNKYDDQVSEEFRFDIAMLLSSVKNTCQKKIGLIIDLTNTTRFYDSKTAEKLGCSYTKLHCRGHDEAPQPEQVQAFINLCDHFALQKPNEVVGVHCTHGFNRTGFLIVCYLVEKFDYSVDAAVKAFADARPPGIYKGDYLRELFAKYDDVSGAPPPPVLPDWCTESDDRTDDDGNSVHDSGSGSSPAKRRRPEHSKANPTFAIGVTGVIAVGEPKLSQIQRRVQEMCGWEDSGFPGCQPVSMDVKNIAFMREKKYMVSWKADGTRYMMLIDGPGNVYMVDRDNSVFAIPNLEFPRRKDLGAHISATLLDGEMVVDQDKVNGVSVPRYLIYDVIKFQDQDTGKTEFQTRLQCINLEIIGPRKAKQESGMLDRSREPFGVRAKPFYDIYPHVHKLLSPAFAKDLGHEIDGLIFQPAGSKDIYHTGRQDDVLKWKPPHLNSVDFRLRVVKEHKTGMLPETKGYLYVGSYEKPFAQIKLNKDLKELDNKIIECHWDPKEHGGWKYMRVRTDKSFPNSYTTAMAVCESIANPVTQERLLSEIEHHRWQPGRSSGSSSSGGSSRPPSGSVMPPPPAPKVRPGSHQQPRSTANGV